MSDEKTPVTPISPVNNGNPGVPPVRPPGGGAGGPPGGRPPVRSVPLPPEGPWTPPLSLSNKWLKDIYTVGPQKGQPNGWVTYYSSPGRPIPTVPPPGLDLNSLPIAPEVPEGMSLDRRWTASSVNYQGPTGTPNQPSWGQPGGPAIPPPGTFPPPNTGTQPPRPPSGPGVPPPQTVWPPVGPLPDGPTTLPSGIVPPGSTTFKLPNGEVLRVAPAGMSPQAAAVAGYDVVILPDGRAILFPQNLGPNQPLPPMLPTPPKPGLPPVKPPSPAPRPPTIPPPPKADLCTSPGKGIGTTIVLDFALKGFMQAQNDKRPLSRFFKALGLRTPFYGKGGKAKVDDPSTWNIRNIGDIVSTDDGLKAFVEWASNKMVDNPSMLDMSCDYPPLDVLGNPTTGSVTGQDTESSMAKRLCEALKDYARQKIAYKKALEDAEKNPCPPRPNDIKNCNDAKKAFLDKIKKWMDGPEYDLRTSMEKMKDYADQQAKKTCNTSGPDYNEFCCAKWSDLSDQIENMLWGVGSDRVKYMSYAMSLQQAIKAIDCSQCVCKDGGQQLPLDAIKSYNSAWDSLMSSFDDFELKCQDVTRTFQNLKGTWCQSSSSSSSGTAGWYCLKYKGDPNAKKECRYRTTTPPSDVWEVYGLYLDALPDNCNAACQDSSSSVSSSSISSSVSSSSSSIGSSSSSIGSSSSSVSSSSSSIGSSSSSIGSSSISSSSSSINPTSGWYCLRFPSGSTLCSYYSSTPGTSTDYTVSGGPYATETFCYSNCAASSSSSSM